MAASDRPPRNRRSARHPAAAVQGTFPGSRLLAIPPPAAASIVDAPHRQGSFGDFGDSAERRDAVLIPLRPNDPDMFHLAPAAPTADRHGNAVVTFARVFLLVEVLPAGLKLRFRILDLLVDLFE